MQIVASNILSVIRQNKYLILVFVMASTVTVFFQHSLKVSSDSVVKINDTCFSVDEKTVRGDSMTGIIEPDSIIKVFLGYYKCNEIKKGDIVLYNFTGNADPLVKIVKGVPGDKFSFMKVENSWNILINQVVLRNMQNEPYVLDERSHSMLSLYEHDYKGIIPMNSYLILGNLATGSVDSTHFGLVGREDILDKVDY